MKKRFSAFSLIELSVVILIIGIMIGGITEGSRLIQEARLKSAQRLTKSSPVMVIKGLVLWLETSLTEDSFVGGDRIDDGYKVTGWKSINSQTSDKVIAVNTTGTGPTYKMIDTPNGVPSLLFNGTNSVLTLSSSPTGTPKQIITNTRDGALTIFVVSQNSAPSATSTIVSNRSDSGGWWSYGTSGGNRVGFLGQLGDIQLPYGNATQDLEILSNYYTGNVNYGYDQYGQQLKRRMLAWINGVHKNVDASWITDVGAQGTFLVGADSNTSGTPQAFFSGYISEIIIFDRALHNRDRCEVETYLGKKYNIKVGKASCVPGARDDTVPTTPVS